MKFTLLIVCCTCSLLQVYAQGDGATKNKVKSYASARHDTSPVLSSITSGFIEEGNASDSYSNGTQAENNPAVAGIEQTSFGTRPAARLVTSFDGLGVGFTGPQGTVAGRNPSDNSLAVGPDHIMQTVNSVMAIYTKKGKKYDASGKVLYGPVNTNNVFRGFGGPCEKINNGDAVVRYDQLANRWLIVMPTFRRAALRNDSVDVKLPQPGKAAMLYQPPADPQGGSQQRPRQNQPSNPAGSFCMCYAISTGPDPFGSYYRYEFKRDLFPDYPRPAIWPDGYYTSTSTGDDVIERHAYVVDRTKMLKGEDATEQSFILNGVNFVINADLDGKQLPPAGAPSILMAAGGDQLNKVMEDNGIYVWKHYVNWADPAKSKLEGPLKIEVAPYHYLCDGQLTKCVPQPGTDQRLDSQGDKLMARLVYRRIGNQESVVAVHSVNTQTGGGVRWYEFRVDKGREVSLYQQGTYAPQGNYRWMASPAMDKNGNIGIGYSFGGTDHFPGQRFAGRIPTDSLGVLTLNEAVLVEGEASQINTLRWEDYSQTAVDPSDDCTVWYVGDYLKKDAKSYSTKIGAFKMPGCK